MPLIRLIKLKTGYDLRRCKGCGLCSKVVSDDQDIPLFSLIQLIIMDDEEVLTSRTVWSDEIFARSRNSCERGFNLQEILLVLREEAVQRGLV